MIEKGKILFIRAHNHSLQSTLRAVRCNWELTDF